MSCYFCGCSQKDLIKTQKWSIQLCRKCHIASTSPPPILPDYQSLDFYEFDHRKDPLRLTHLHDLPPDWQELIGIQIEMIKKNVSLSARILEIGCGEGLLIGELYKTGYKVCGIEPSKSAAKRASIRQIEVLNGSFPEVIPAESVDLIILSQTFEHFEDPVYIIKEIRKICASGFIMFTQTNFRGLIPKIQKSKWYGWVPEQHFWHFTLKGLTNLLETYGVILIDSQYSSLVHPHNYSYRMAKLIPAWQDQFTAIYKLIR